MKAKNEAQSFVRRLTKKELHAVTVKGVLAVAEQRAGKLKGTERLGRRARKPPVGREATGGRTRIGKRG